MNETMTTPTSDLPKNERKFADVIIEIVEAKYKVYQAEHKKLHASPVALENIHFGPDDFKDFPHIMQGIKPYQEVEKTVKEMLGSLSWSYREIEASHGGYRLNKDGRLYKHLEGIIK